MDTVLWILAGLLAAVSVAAGAMKLAQPKEKLVASPNMAWAEDFSPRLLKTIGSLELLAAVGLILPATFDVVPILVPLAAIGLALLMFGALLTHAHRAEFGNIPVTVVLLATAIVVAWGRLGPHEF